MPRTADFTTDLASVPMLFTWLVPKSGAHLPAALLHDGLVGGAAHDPASYVSTEGHVVARDEAFTEIVEGFAKGCKENNCSLIGGETAQMPDTYLAGAYDVAAELSGFKTREVPITIKGAQAFSVTLERAPRPAILDLRAASDGTALGATGLDDLEKVRQLAESGEYDDARCERDPLRGPRLRDLGASRKPGRWGWPCLWRGLPPPLRAPRFLPPASNPMSPASARTQRAGKWCSARASRRSATPTARPWPRSPPSSRGPTRISASAAPPSASASPASSLPPLAS